jgi:hypothetical protein
VTAPSTTADFTRMDDTTAEQFAVVISEAQHHLNARLVDTMVSLLDTAGFR